METISKYTPSLVRTERSAEDELLHLVDVIAATEQKLLSGEEAQMGLEHCAMHAVYTMPNSRAKIL